MVVNEEVVLGVVFGGGIGGRCLMEGTVPVSYQHMEYCNPH